MPSIVVAQTSFALEPQISPMRGWCGLSMEVSQALPFQCSSTPAAISPLLPMRPRHEYCWEGLWEGPTMAFERRKMSFLSRSVKWLPRLLGGLGAWFTLGGLFPVAGCINLGRCQNSPTAVSACAGRSEKACNSIPGCTTLPLCVSHCVGLAETSCAMDVDCYWFASASECIAKSSQNDPCVGHSIVTCTQNAACKVGTDCQGDVDCNSIADENECRGTNGCYYQQGMT